MKNVSKNPLSRKKFEGDALTQIFSKISRRFPKRFSRLTIIVFLALFFSGYHPVLTFPQVKFSHALAEEKQIQTDRIESSSFPQPVILPHPGYLSTRFSAYHPGVDIASGLDMPIHPINPGTIREAGRDFFGLGNFITVTHPNGFESRYAHLGVIYVKVGDEVTEESMLGKVGLTGNTSGPHTHLEITFQGKYIDPQTILPEIPPMPYATTK